MRMVVQTIAVVILLALYAAPAGAAVYGVGQNRAASPSPDTRLFSFSENLASSSTPTPINPIGTVNVDGTNIFVDGIAMTPQRELYGFEYTSSGTTAQLVSIDTSDASAVRIGAPIAANISAATFDLPTNLWALNVISDRTVVGGVVTSTGAGQLLRIDTASGAVQQTLNLIVPDLHGEFEGMTWSGSGDIAVDHTGVMWLGTDYFDLNTGGRSGVFTINLNTGEISDLLRTHIGTRNVSGLAFSKQSVDDPTTSPFNEEVDGYWFEASGTDDVHRVRLDNNLAAYGPHVLDVPGQYGFTALDRGDLAGAMPEPSTTALVLGSALLMWPRRSRPNAMTRQG